MIDVVPTPAHPVRMSSPLKLSRQLSKIPIDHYYLPDDRGTSAARDRMALAEWRGIHGDADGSRIFPSVKSMSEHFRWSRRKTFYLLGDLKELRLIESTGHYAGEHGTRIWKMNVAVFLGEVARDSAEAGVQIAVAGVQSKDAHNRHLIDTKEKDDPRFAVSANPDIPKEIKSAPRRPVPEELRKKRDIEAQLRREKIQETLKFKAKEVASELLAGSGPVAEGRANPRVLENYRQRMLKRA